MSFSSALTIFLMVLRQIVPAHANYAVVFELAVASKAETASDQEAVLKC